MTTITLHKGKWIVSDKGERWEFRTHKQAQEKVHELMSEKLKEMAKK
jgi:hypothetical protein